MLAREGTDEVDAMESPSVTFLGVDQEKIKKWAEKYVGNAKKFLARKF